MDTPVIGFSTSNFRVELGNTLQNQLGYLTSQFEDGAQALEEVDGQLAFLFDGWLKKAFIAGHAAGVQACIKDNSLPLDFDPTTDAVYAERQFLAWKNS